MELLIAALSVLAAALASGGFAAWLSRRAINSKIKAEANLVDADAAVTLGVGWAALYNAATGATALCHEELVELRERIVALETYIKGLESINRKGIRGF